MESDLKKVIITHFTNPHKFWFKYVPCDEVELEIKKLEESITEYIKRKKTIPALCYERGDFVAVKYIPWKRYIRGRVLEVTFCNSLESDCIIWALDYGFPIQTPQRWVLPLPTDFEVRIKNIMHGGLANIVPFEKSFDKMTFQPIEVLSDKWIERPCKAMNKLIQAFSNDISLKYCLSANDHIWCDLFINKTNSITKHLAKKQMGKLMSEEEFQEKLKSIQTLKHLPWLHVNGTDNLYKNQHMASQYATHATLNVNWCDGAADKVSDWMERNLPPSYELGELCVSNDDESVEKCWTQKFLDLEKDSSINSLTELPPMPDASEFCTTKLTVGHNSDLGSDIPNESNTKDNKILSNSNVSEIEATKASSSVIDAEVTEQIRELKLNDNWSTAAKLNAIDHSYISPFEDLIADCNTSNRFNSINILPVGFDVTQNVKYKDPYHWHRKITTLGEDTTHDTDFLINERRLDLLEPQVAATISKSKIQDLYNEKWITLLAGPVDIKLSKKANWSNIYAQITSSLNAEKYNALQKYLTEIVPTFLTLHEDQLKLQHIYVVFYRGSYQRVKLMDTYIDEIDGTRFYRFFLVDIAEFFELSSLDVALNNIYEATRHIVEFTEFQAVHFTLAGIILNTEISVDLQDLTKHSLYAIPGYKSVNNLNNLNINSYSVLLFKHNNTTNVTLNQQIVDMGFAVIDEKTKMLLDFKPNAQDEFHFDDSEVEDDSCAGYETAEDTFSLTGTN